MVFSSNAVIWILDIPINKTFLPGEPNTEYEEAVLSLTLGYFFFDLLWILKYKTEGPAMYFHHLSSIVSLLFILFRGNSASEVLVGKTF